MAFLKYAKAKITKPYVHGVEWDNVRVASGNPKFDRNLIHQASEILGDRFTPANYLLTHATIIASVDVDEVPNIKLGKVSEDGLSINRKFSNYRVRAGCDKYINNNLDCWSRPTLLKSYRTFIGAHNFCEHVQIEDLSKGRIIDAVPRDIGDSVYVDILVATNRKHASLIQDIESGRMNSMSMGCSVDFTLCTKCGNVAVDETQMCPHIKYEKGNVFYDSHGTQHRIAELCGHDSIDPTGGVTFIEGSWVAIPAFTGAVTRNIVNLSDLKGKPATISEGVITVPSFDISLNRLKSAAIAGLFSDSEEEAEKSDAVPEEKSDFQDIEEGLKQVILDKVLKDLKGQITKNDGSGESSTSLNDTIVKEGQTYSKTVRKLVASSDSSSDFVIRLASFNRMNGIDLHPSIYKAALRVGRLGQYKSQEDFERACFRALGRKTCDRESAALIRISKLVAFIKENENAT